MPPAAYSAQPGSFRPFFGSTLSWPTARDSPGPAGSSSAFSSLTFLVGFGQAFRVRNNRVAFVSRGRFCSFGPIRLFGAKFCPMSGRTSGANLVTFGRRGFRPLTPVFFPCSLVQFFKPILFFALFRSFGARPGLQKKSVRSLFFVPSHRV